MATDKKTAEKATPASFEACKSLGETCNFLLANYDNQQAVPALALVMLKSALASMKRKPVQAQKGE